MVDVVAPIPGLVARVPVKEGQRVNAGDTVVVLNVMKTEVNVQADTAGVVKEVKVKEWDEVDIGTVLVVLDSR
ncbi:Methylmalonyl-CoA carboxyltransferase 1.3S subunit [archaeon HR01]|nr:Methylmalonyl-CoA carboxyltransferase 1.3S subunit [archaeon HR01]